MEYAQKGLALDEYLSDAHAALGLVYLVKRKWDKAVEECGLAVSLNPSCADTIVNAAMVYRAVGPVQEALALLTQAIHLNPMPPNFYLHEFASCYRIVGRYDEAIAMLTRVLDSDSDNLFTRLNLTATYVMSGEEEAAHTEAMEVLKQSPFSRTVVNELPLQGSENYRWPEGVLDDQGMIEVKSAGFLTGLRLST
jgi:tetratricopeptide (TPR) repeat protein